LDFRRNIFLKNFPNFKILQESFHRKPRCYMRTNKQRDG